MARLEDRVLDLTGGRVSRAKTLHGGDLSKVTLLTLQDGSQLVAKEGTRVATEARMLTAIRDAGAPAPEVIVSDGDLLLIEALEERAPTPTGWGRLGEALAALHTATGAAYGWSEDYAFGPVTIPNGRSPDWPDFWAAHRLLTHTPYLPGGLAPRIANLCEKLPVLLPQTPPKALLHGDLWSGNLMFGSQGTVHLIDPACYRGDPEVDLAMLHLFGQPGGEFHEAYGPLAPGWENRRAVYTLWPALVHLRLFGTSYRAMVDRILTSLGV